MRHPRQGFIGEKLIDQSQPISEGYRALFFVRNLSGPAVGDALIPSTCVCLKSFSSPLLLLYVDQEDVEQF
ncbi:hypothetical protein EJ110_NYTH08100 [Nymphaea thermarum]|nr:hypothetical protein EJ110_NYTH08100 [Nymphaea thermarum]